MIWLLLAGAYFAALPLFLFGLSRTPRRRENNSRIINPLIEQMRDQRPYGDRSVLPQIFAPSHIDADTQ